MKMSTCEVQALLEDESEMCSQYKNKCEQVQQENSRLQDDCILVSEEIKQSSTVGVSKNVQEKYKGMFEEACRKIAEKNAEIVELRSKVLTPVRLQLIHSQVTNDLKSVYTERFNKQKLEAEKYRTLCNKLKCEITIVQSEYNHSMLETKRKMDEVKLRAEAEVINLRREREAAIELRREANATDTEKACIVQKERAMLMMQVKSLTSELEDVRSSNEKLVFESDNVIRVHDKQTAEYSRSIKSFEFERESLRQQVDQLQRDNVETGTIHNKLMSDIHKLEKENVTLKSKMDELIHRNKVELANLKMKMISERAEIEREKDRLTNVVEDLYMKLDIANHKIESRNKSLMEKEQYFVGKTQAAREEGFIKILELEDEKIGLETKLQESEKRRADQEELKHAEREKTEEAMCCLQNAKHIAEQDLASLKIKISNQEALHENIDKERRENKELKAKIARLESEIETHIENKHSMTDENLKLKNQIEILKNEMILVTGQLKKFQNSHDVILQNKMSSHNEEKCRLDQRLQDLQSRMIQIQRKYQKAIVMYKKYQTRSNLIVDNLQRKLEILHAEKKNMESDNKAFQPSVLQEKYNKMKNSLMNLQRQHTHFRRFLYGEAQMNSYIGDIPPVSETISDHNFFFPVGNISLLDNDVEHKKALRELKERINKLDDCQQQQLGELQNLQHHISMDIPTIQDQDQNLRWE